MNNRINIPIAISYLKVVDILSFTTSANGSCRVEANNWVTIPFVKGSVNFEIDSKRSVAGKVYTTELSTNISELREIRSKVLIKLQFEDSDTLIVGVPDIPVTLDVDFSLTRKRLKFSHKNWHKPLKLVS